jgi:hypothetical protein
VRELLEGIRTVGVHVDKMARRLLDPAHGPPEIRIAGVLGDGRLVLLEVGTNLTGQQRNRPGHDELVDLDAPRERGARCCDQRDDNQRQDKACSHDQ